jgi:ribonuclease G
VKKEIYINVEDTENRIAVLEDGVLEEYYFERSGSKRLAGSLYRGRVSKVVPGIQACFVNIGLRKNGFLHVSDIVDPSKTYAEMMGEEVEEGAGEPESRRGGAERSVPLSTFHSRLSKQGHIEDLLHGGDDLLIQVVKDPLGEKGPRLTTNISLPGRNLVLVPRSRRRGISRRIEDVPERERLKKILDTLPVPENMGVIVRTFAQGETKKTLLRDLRFLVNLWKRIEKRYKETKKPGPLYEETDIVKQFLRDAMSEEIARIVVDSKAEYKELKKFIHTTLPKSKTQVELHKDRQPLFEKFGIEKEIEKAFQSRVWLKCGGYLVIEKFEALVAIDVNTGRNIGAEDAEQTILATNLEAAREIARQLRLRNMGGIIVIDFIDMKTKTNRKAVYDELKRSLKRDKARTFLVPISELGLLEMTRERDRESLGESLFGKCPYCNGTGDVKLPETVSIEVQREVKRIASERKAGELKVYAHPSIVERLKTTDSPALARILKHGRLNIELLSVNDYHLEQWNCYVDEERRGAEARGKGAGGRASAGKSGGPS